MARSIHKLTEIIVRQISAPGFYADGAGVYLQVSPTLSKSFVFRYSLDGKTRDMGLGSLKKMSLQDARARATEARQLRDKGIDPIEARNALRASPTRNEIIAALPGLTFRQRLEQYIAEREEPAPRENRTGFIPVVGNVPIDQIIFKPDPFSGGFVN